MSPHHLGERSFAETGFSITVIASHPIQHISFCLSPTHQNGRHSHLLTLAIPPARHEREYPSEANISSSKTSCLLYTPPPLPQPPHPHPKPSHSQTNGAPFWVRATKRSLPKLWSKFELTPCVVLTHHCSGFAESIVDSSRIPKKQHVRLLLLIEQ